MHKISILIVLLVSTACSSKEYYFEDFKPVLKLSIEGKTQAGLTHQRFEIKKLSFVNAEKQEAPTFGFYIVHFQGEQWGPAIVEHVPGHSPLLKQDGNSINLYYIAGGNTNVLQKWEWNPDSSTLEKISETGISWQDRPDT